MKRLLEELKTLDPALYHEIEEFYLIRNVADGIDYVSDEFGHHSSLSIPDEYEEDIIQGCVQRTIKAIGYMFSVSHTWPKASYPAYEWIARIFIDPDNIIEMRDDSPAKAILTAYIAARKSRP